MSAWVAEKWDKLAFFIDNAAWERAMIGTSCVVLSWVFLLFAAAVLYDLGWTISHGGEWTLKRSFSLALGLAFIAVGWTFGNASWWWITWQFAKDPTPFLAWERAITALLSLLAFLLFVGNRYRHWRRTP